MRIVASHSDGFTEHLLRWRLEIVDGRADLDADWFGNPSPLKATFAIDEGPFRAALPGISGMDGRYQAPVEDQATHDLLVEDGERSIRLHVYGAGFLLQDHPEVRGFLAFWRLLERAIAGSLPGRLRP